MGVLLAGAAIGTAFAVFQKHLFFSQQTYMETNYEYIQGVITSINREENVFTMRAAGNTFLNATPQEKYTFRIGEDTGIYPMAIKKKGDNTWLELVTYPSMLKKKEAIQEGKQATALIDKRGDISKAVSFHYEIDLK